MNFDDINEEYIKAALDKKGATRYDEYKELLNDLLPKFKAEIEVSFADKNVSVFFETDFNAAQEPYIKIVVSNNQNASTIVLFLISMYAKYAIGTGNGGLTASNNAEALKLLTQKINQLTWLRN
jgi:hypothetical protein